MSRSTENLPPLFVERLRRIIPVNRWESVIRSFETPKPTTFRVNTLKAKTPAVRKQLSSAGFQTQRVAWYPDALILQSGRLRDLQETDLYRTGCIYVQSLPSMLPPLVLEPKPGETILDLTAAPGSKTTQIACLMNGQGRLVANDNNKIRFFKLRANLEMQAAGFVETTLRYGEAFGREFPNTFDRVLADVPCSAEGRFDANDPKSFGFWKPMKVREMARKQKRLLYSAIQALKPGGVLVYSTCTFAPEENEAVIHWVLEKFGRAVSVEPVALQLTNTAAGLSRWDKWEFNPAVRLTKRVLPGPEMEGFFLAKLRKHTETKQEGSFGSDEAGGRESK